MLLMTGHRAGKQQIRPEARSPDLWLQISPIQSRTRQNLSNVCQLRGYE